MSENTMMFKSILKSVIRTGCLRFVDATGRAYLIGDESPPCATIRLRSKRTEYALAINPALSVGEAYMNGELMIEEGSLYDILKLVALNFNDAHRHPWLSLIEHAEKHLKQHNPIAEARRNVAHHYDLSAELYATFLDRDWQYSCAYFRSQTESLDTAQENKKRHIAAKLFLNRPGLNILDIGSGWGGLGLYLAAEADANITGVTLSVEQQKHSEARAAAAGPASNYAITVKNMGFMIASSPSACLSMLESGIMRNFLQSSVSFSPRTASLCSIRSATRTARVP
jgi:cyclopropane-fatty-acyl-phospholipid synthase